MEANKDTKEQILKVAYSRMSEVGIRSVSIDDICHEIGISKKTFYVWFATKDELIEALLHRQLEKVRVAMEQFFEGDNTIWQAIQCAASKMSSIPDMRKLPPFVYDLNKYYPLLAKAHNKAVDAQNISVMSRLIRKGQAEGVFRAEVDVEMAAYLFARLHSMAVSDSVLHDGAAIPVKRMADFTMDVLLRGMFTEEGEKKYVALRDV